MEWLLLTECQYLKWLPCDCPVGHLSSRNALLLGGLCDTGHSSFRGKLGLNDMFAKFPTYLINLVVLNLFDVFPFSIISQHRNGAASENPSSRKTDTTTLQCQCHVCWWPSDTRSHCISIHGTDLFLQEYYSLITRIFKVFNCHRVRKCVITMTSSNGIIFRVTGHLCGEFTGARWIPHTKASDAELWCFLWSASE